ncbi:MAG TPA: glycosyltransferase family 4 protein [Chitinophagaceae bacterium]|nr:glycosyltransferase family 4 protein [Chitinophagaceae bacterium]
MNKKSILVLGLFLKSKNEKSSIRTVEDRVAEMFTKANVNTIISSRLSGKISRLFDTVYTVITARKEYDIAVVPLFGTWPSFLWQEVVTRLLKLLRKKIVLGIHGGSIPERTDRGAQRFTKALKRADELIAPSPYLCNYFEKKDFNVHIIENPVNLSEYTFHYKKKIRPRILWMRAFTEVYNPEMAIRVGKRLADKFNDFQMVMAGKNGLLSSAIKKMVGENGLSGKIIFPGYINMEEKLQFANDYDIYICTNRIDNAPVSLIEFMSFGLPIVSVNVGGIPYLIKDGQNGLLVNPDDDEAMFKKICLLLDNPALVESICLNAYQYAQQYDEKNIIKKWKALIEEMECA